MNFRKNITSLNQYLKSRYFFDKSEFIDDEPTFNRFLFQINSWRFKQLLYS